MLPKVWLEAVQRYHHTDRDDLPKGADLACDECGTDWPCDKQLLLDDARLARTLLAQALADLHWAWDYFEERGFSSHRMRFSETIAALQDAGVEPLHEGWDE